MTKVFVTRDARDKRMVRLGEGPHGMVPVKVIFPEGFFPPVRYSLEGVDIPIEGEIRIVKSIDNITILSIERSNSYLIGICDVPPGYRGSSTIEVVGARTYVKYPLYKSPQGKLGIGEGVVFDYPVDGRVVVFFKREGRLYGDPDRGAVLFRGKDVLEINYAENMEELRILSPVPID